MIISPKTIKVLVLYIYNTLTVDIQREIFCSYYTSILKEILQNRKTSICISLKVFGDFLQFFEASLLEENIDIKKDQNEHISSTLKVFISDYPRDIKDYEKKIFGLYRDFFKKVSSKLNERFLLNMISGFNHFIYYNGIHLYEETREVGDEILNNLCQIWRDKPSEILKNEISKFIKLIISLKPIQIALNNIDEVYFLFRDTINNSRFSNHNKNIVAERKDEKRNLFFNVASDVFYQFSKKGNNNNDQKKRKFISIEQEIIEKLTTETSVEILENWLKLLIYLLKYPFTTEFLKNLSKILFEILEKREQMNIKNLAINVLEKVLLWNVKESFDSNFWEELFNLCMKYLQTETNLLIDSVLSLLKCYFNLNIVTNNENVYTILESVFFKNSEFCSTKSLLFLLQVFKIQELTKLPQYKKDLFQWVFLSFKNEKVVNEIDYKISSNFLFSLITSSIVIPPEDELTLEEKLLTKISYYQNPLIYKEQLVLKQQDYTIDQNLFGYFVQIFQNYLANEKKIHLTVFQVVFSFSQSILIEKLNEKNRNDYISLLKNVISYLLNENSKKILDHLKFSYDIINLIDPKLFIEEHENEWKKLIEKVILIIEEKISAPQNSQVTDLMDEDIEDKNIFSEDKKEVQIYASKIISILIQKYPKQISNFEKFLLKEVEKSRYYQVKFEFLEILIKSNLKEKILETIRSMVDQYKGHCEENIKIMNLLQMVYQSLSKNSLSKIKEILEEYKEQLDKKILCLKTRLSLIDLLLFFGKNEGNYFSDLIPEMFLLLLDDSYYQVRLYTSENIFVLFEIFEDSIEVLKAILDILDNHLDKNDLLYSKSSLICLCQISYKIPKVEQEILLYILKIYSKYKMKEYVQQSFDFISRNLKYSSTEDLLKDNLKFIIQNWIEDEKLKFEDFPFLFFGYLDLKSFTESHISLILPFILYKDFKFLNSLSRILNKDQSLLVRENFSSVYSFLLLLPPENSTELENQVKKYIKDIKSVIPQEFEGILKELLSLSSIEKEPKLPYFSQSHVKSVIQKFIQSLNSSALFSETRVLSILLNLLENISSTHRSNYRKEYFFSFHLFIHIIDKEYFFKKSILRMIIHILLYSSNFIEIKEESCELLLNIIEEAIEDNNSTNEIGKNMNRIINQMIKITELNHTNTDLIYRQKSYKILKRLIIKCPTHLEKYLKELEPFPNHSVFKEFENVKFRDKKLSIWKEIEIFNSREGHNGLAFITKLIREKKQEMNLQMNHPLNQNILSEFITKLTLLCNGKFEEKYEATKCLAELGLTAPSFKNYEMYKEFEFTNVQLKGEWKFESYMGQIKVHILNLLNLYLLDSDVNIVKISSHLLVYILSTNSGKNAFLLLDKETQQYLEPFKNSSFLDKSRKIQVPKPLELNQSLFETQNKTHEEWVQNVTYSLIKNCVKDEVFSLCGVLCKYNTNFAENIFQFSLFDIAVNKKIHLNQLLSPLFENFLLNKYSNSKSIRLLLNSLNMIRKSTREEYKKKGVPKTTSIEREYWFNIPYLSVIKSAINVEAYFTALVYLETECDINPNNAIPKDTMLFEENATDIQIQLLKIYKKIDDPDGIYGVNRNFGPQSLILKYEHEGNWEKVLSYYEILAMKSDEKNLQNMEIGVIKSLRNNGHQHSVQLCLNALNMFQKTKEGQEIIYENAWRNSIWETDIQTNQENFHKKMFKCLKSLKMGDSNTFWKSFNSCKEQILQQLGSYTSLYQDLSKLEMISEVYDAWKLRWGSTNEDETIFKHPKIPKDDEIKYRRDYGISNHSFLIIEPILTLRGILLQCLEREDLYPDHITSFSRIARKSERFDFSLNLINPLVLKKSISASNPSLLFENAKLLWIKGEQDSAISIGKFLIQNIKYPISNQKTFSNLLGKVSCKVGNWLDLTRSESAHFIISNFMKDATKFSEKKSKSYYTVAKFYDRLYTELYKKTKTEEWKNFIELCEENEKTLNLLKQNKVEKSAIEKQCEKDKKEIQEFQTKLETFLNGSMDSYGEAIKEDSKYDLHIIFRICSFWFTNAENEGKKEYNSELNKKLEEMLKHIDPSKFIPLIYQIASRMGSHSKEFQSLNMKLLKMIAKKHPYHSLYQIFALSNGARIPSDQKSKEQFVFAEEKIKSAKDLLKDLTQSGLSEIISQIEKLIESYIEISFLSLDKSKIYRNSIKIDSSLKITSIKNLNLIPIPTEDLQIQKDGIYRGFEYVDQFDKEINLAGGVNLPKIIKCQSSQGNKYRQLVKGKDDLRQDAVMQQIFELVNSLLIHSPKKLRIRTYKIIPLSPSSGLLGWVENTIPLASYLLNLNDEKTSAHVRYRPKDWTPYECAIKMKESNQSKVDKYNIFMDICKNFKPVFRHFFFENFTTPSEWFSKRLDYTKSVASNSIIGYIIGLGDRHANNILMDLKTAEVVHIDLGISFDQGKLLPIPELVPFRLTRDIIDGFGIQGIEGTFRRCSEEMMNLLRKNSSLIFTVLEVFIHDPLYKWALDPEKMLKVQKNEENQFQLKQKKGNRNAEMILIRLNEKLQGYEDGEILSVKGQVNKLINQAKDPKSLSSMFSGWSAWA